MNSAPIAPKTNDLHPKGPLPQPLPKADPQDIPHFTDDLVRSALSTFGPGSAAGLFGIKPVLLQQATRAESYNFGSTLTRACNYFAHGKGPEFLRPLMAASPSHSRSRRRRFDLWRAETRSGAWWQSVSVSARRPSARRSTARTTASDARVASKWSPTPFVTL